MDPSLIAFMALAFAGAFVGWQIRSLRTRRARLLAEHKDPKTVDAMMRDLVAHRAERSLRVPRWLAVIVLLTSVPALALGIGFWLSGPDMILLALVFGGIGLYGTVHGLYMLITGKVS